MSDYFRQRIGIDPAERAQFTYIDDFGYCGGATMLIQFDRLLRSGQMRQGDLVAAYLEESSKWMSGGFIARM